MLTFNQWLAQRRVTDSPRGDFIADWRCDRSFPDGITSIYKLLAYLIRRGAHREATDVARGLWRQYAREQGRPYWARRHDGHRRRPGPPDIRSRPAGRLRTGGPVEKRNWVLGVGISCEGGGTCRVNRSYKIFRRSHT